jgi:hypothetical protein
MPSVWSTGLVALALAALHLLAGQVAVLRSVPRSRLLSLASGASVAYVFVHLLPEVAARQLAVVEAAGRSSIATALGRERVLFVAALVGFVAFYGLEQLAHRSGASARGDDVAGDAGSRTTAGVFWIHVGSFAVYNALIGYFLLHREEPGGQALVLYGTAMGLHFLVNDYGLRDHHQEAYDAVGRWVLAVAVLVGFAVGVILAVPEHVLSLLLAFVAGSVVLNVIKEELPEDRESRFWPFGVGVAGYGLLLLFV